ncbi:hypothetical protein [Sphaerisporangium perillae]|uniref:hypothetical protein n=1 Tax=Sphaerisporangium perillae TaxID=2935860 RepID=UPI00200EE0D6|nr:hypothetical protein [Sphaerisporangium perillae]
MTGGGDRARESIHDGDKVCDPYGFPPTAGISVGGYFPGTTGRPVESPPVPEVVPALVERQITALEQTYPAWRITRATRPDGTPRSWWATRHRPLRMGASSRVIWGWRPP